MKRFLQGLAGFLAGAASTPLYWLFTYAAMHKIGFIYPDADLSGYWFQQVTASACFILFTAVNIFVYLITKKKLKTFSMTFIVSAVSIEIYMWFMLALMKYFT